MPIGVDQLTKEGRARSIKLYAILTSYIVGRSSKLLRNVQHSNGIELETSYRDPCTSDAPERFEHFAEYLPTQSLQETP